MNYTPIKDDEILEVTKIMEASLMQGLSHPIAKTQMNIQLNKLSFKKKFLRKHVPFLV